MAELGQLTASMVIDSEPANRALVRTGAIVSELGEGLKVLRGLTTAPMTATIAVRAEVAEAEMLRIEASVKTLMADFGMLRAEVAEPFPPLVMKTEAAQARITETSARLQALLAEVIRLQEAAAKPLAPVNLRSEETQASLTRTRTQIEAMLAEVAALQKQLAAPTKPLGVQTEQGQKQLAALDGMILKATEDLQLLRDAGAKPVKINIVKGVTGAEVISDEQRRMEDERRAVLAEQARLGRQRFAAERAPLASVKLPPLTPEQQWWTQAGAGTMIQQLTEQTLAYDAVVKKLTADGLTATQIMQRFDQGMVMVQQSTGKAAPYVERLRMEMKMLEATISKAAGPVPELSRRLEVLQRQIATAMGGKTKAHRQEVRELTMRYQHLTGGLIVMSMMMTRLTGDVEKGTEQQKKLKKGLQEGSRAALETTFFLSMMGPTMAKLAGPIGIAIGALTFLIEAFHKTDVAAEQASESMKGFSEELVKADTETLTVALAAMDKFKKLAEEAAAKEREISEKRMKDLAEASKVKLSPMQEALRGAAAPQMMGVEPPLPEVLTQSENIEKSFNKQKTEAEAIVDVLKEAVQKQQEINHWADLTVAVISEHGTKQAELNAKIAREDMLIKSGSLNEKELKGHLDKRRGFQQELNELMRDSWTIASEQLAVLQWQYETHKGSAEAVLAKLRDMRKMVTAGADQLAIDKQIYKIEQELIEKAAKHRELERKFWADRREAAVRFGELAADIKIEAKTEPFEKALAEAAEEYRKTLIDLNKEAVAGAIDPVRAAKAAADAKLAFDGKVLVIIRERTRTLADYQRSLDEMRVNAMEDDLARTIMEVRQMEEQQHESNIRMIEDEYALRGNLAQRERDIQEENARYDAVRRRRAYRESKQAATELTGQLEGAVSSIVNLFKIGSDTFVGKLAEGLQILMEMLRIVELIVTLMATIKALQTVFSMVPGGGGGTGIRPGVGVGPPEMPKIAPGEGLEPTVAIAPVQTEAYWRARTEEPAVREVPIVISGTVDISNGQIFLRQEMPRYEKFKRRKYL